MRYILLFLMIATIHLGTDNCQAHAHSWFVEKTSEIILSSRAMIQRLFHKNHDHDAISDYRDMDYSDTQGDYEKPDTISLRSSSLKMYLRSSPLQMLSQNEGDKISFPSLTTEEAKDLTSSQLKFYLRLVWKDQLQ